MKDLSHLARSLSAHSPVDRPAGCRACPALPGGLPAETVAHVTGATARRRPRRALPRGEAFTALPAG